MKLSFGQFFLRFWVGYWFTAFFAPLPPEATCQDTVIFGIVLVYMFCPVQGLSNVGTADFVYTTTTFFDVTLKTQNQEL